MISTGTTFLVGSTISGTLTRKGALTRVLTKIAASPALGARRIRGVGDTSNCSLPYHNIPTTATIATVISIADTGKGAAISSTSTAASTTRNNSLAFAVTMAGVKTGNTSVGVAPSGGSSACCFSVCPTSIISRVPSSGRLVTTVVNTGSNSIAGCLSANPSNCSGRLVRRCVPFSPRARCYMITFKYGKATKAATIAGREFAALTSSNRANSNPRLALALHTKSTGNTGASAGICVKTCTPATANTCCKMFLASSIRGMLTRKTSCSTVIARGKASVSAGSK